MSDEARALQRYLRDAAHSWAIVITTPSFDVCLHPADALVYLNYALPHGGADAAAFAAEHASIERAFAARERIPRFEFVDDASPELARELEAAGYREEPPATAMACIAGDLIARRVDDIAIDVYTEATSDDDVREAIRVRDAAFGLVRPVDDGAIALYRRNTDRTHTVVARERGTIVGVGTLMPIAHGLAEIAGIGVSQAVRRRGIGGAITAYLAGYAFEHGAHRVVLTAADARATRVYERVGFRPADYRVRAYIRAEAV